MLASSPRSTTPSGSACSGISRKPSPTWGSSTLPEVSLPPRPGTAIETGTIGQNDEQVATLRPEAAGLTAGPRTHLRSANGTLGRTSAAAQRKEVLPELLDESAR